MGISKAVGKDEVLIYLLVVTDVEAQVITAPVTHIQPIEIFSVKFEPGTVPYILHRAYGVIKYIFQPAQRSISVVRQVIGQAKCICYLFCQFILLYGRLEADAAHPVQRIAETGLCHIGYGLEQLILYQYIPAWVDITYRQAFLILRSQEQQSPVKPVLEVLVLQKVSGTGYIYGQLETKGYPLVFHQLIQAQCRQRAKRRVHILPAIGSY